MARRPLKAVLKDLLELSHEVDALGYGFESEQLSMLWATLDGHGWEDISEWIDADGGIWEEAERLIREGKTEELDRFLDLVDEEGVHWKITRIEYSQDWDNIHHYWRPVLKALLERRGPREWAPKKEGIPAGRPAGFVAPAAMRKFLDEE